MPLPLPVLIYFRAKEIVEGGGGDFSRRKKETPTRVVGDVEA